jgi:hypothetical protein
MKFIKRLSWDEVFSAWRSDEANLPRWIKHYKARGFPSWDEWRKNTTKDVDLASLDWKLFDVEKPLDEVPHFQGGPFRAWEKYYGGKTTAPFSEIIKSKELREGEIVKEMMSNFPKETQLVGLKTGERVVIIEGMHRCCALSLLASQNENLQAKVSIALAEFKGELPSMGQENSPT